MTFQLITITSGGTTYIAIFDNSNSSAATQTIVIHPGIWVNTPPALE